MIKNGSGAPSLLAFLFFGHVILIFYSFQQSRHFCVLPVAHKITVEFLIKVIGRQSFPFLSKMLHDLTGVVTKEQVS